MARRVLIVDDSSAMREFVAAILASLGEFEVVEAPNGFEALRQIPREEFDLIITDVNMPDVNGIELVRFVKGRQRGARTPVLVISTDASATDRERALGAGADGFLAKPFTAEHLATELRSLAAKATSEGPDR